ncbi:hypothetical protein [Clostridium intestinale]|uniref:capsular polysaccharide export protein, LipB/KpsS family n=1 Tax=Clostridium intestinale TaxID=36845 RepID=UPI002DD64483|nr:hypothetical protein [Clostridium intestinale]WRY49796.1 hypothetical protein P8F83_13800 [Clostridium intestinale]
MKLELISINNLKDYSNVFKEEDLISEVDKKTCSDLAMEVSLKICSSDFLIYDGVNFMSIMQIQLYNTIKNILSMQLLFNKITSSKGKIDKVIIENWEEYKVFKFINKVNNNYFDIKYLGDEYNLKSFIKYNNKENLVKLFSEFLTLNQNSKINSNKIAIVHEINNQSMIQILNEYQVELEEQGRVDFEFLCVGLGSFRQIVSRNKKVLLKYFTYKVIKEYKAIYVQMSNIFKDNGEQKLQYCLKEIKEDKIRDLVLISVNKIIKNSIKSIIIYYILIRNYLIQTKINKILLCSDSHSISRLICQIAKKYDVLTIVHQHGSIGKIAFTPIYADKFLAWGEYNKNLLINLGEKKDKIIISGNIKYKEFPSEKVDSRNDKVNLLWAVNPIGKSINKELFNILEGYIKLNENIIEKVNIKLHPGEKDKEFMDNLFRNSSVKEKINIIYKGNLIELIKNSNLVLITQSTAGIEAFMCGKTVMLYDNPNIPELLPYRKYKAVILFRNMEEFKNGINNYLNNKCLDISMKSKDMLLDYMKPFDKILFKKMIDNKVNK